MSNLPTVREIIVAFDETITATADAYDDGVERAYLYTLVAELEAVEAAYEGYDGMESEKLQAACARIPGLLHLYKIY